MCISFVGRPISSASSPMRRCSCPTRAASLYVSGRKSNAGPSWGSALAAGAFGACTTATSSRSGTGLGLQVALDQAQVGLRVVRIDLVDREAGVDDHPVARLQVLDETDEAVLLRLAQADQAAVLVDDLDHLVGNP